MGQEQGRIIGADSSSTPPSASASTLTFYQESKIVDRFLPSPELAIPKIEDATGNKDLFYDMAPKTDSKQKAK
jgi:hypothetical protein